MRILLQIISWLALAATVLPSFLYFLGRLELNQTQWIMLVATIVWFVVTPFWMERATSPETSE